MRGSSWDSVSNAVRRATPRQAKAVGVRGAEILLLGCVQALSSRLLHRGSQEEEQRVLANHCFAALAQDDDHDRVQSGIAKGR